MDILQLLITGTTTGAIFALIAIGFSIIFNANGIINFSQGEFVMVGGMSAAVLWSSGVPLALAIPLACAISVIVGVIAVGLVIAPTRRAGHIGTTIATVGFAIFLQGVVRLFFGSTNRRLPAFSEGASIDIAGATIRVQNIWIVVATALSFGVIGLFLTRTATGRAMLGFADNPFAASLMGIRSSTIQVQSFIIGAGVAGLAGALIAPIVFASPTMGTMLGLKGFVAAVVGGLGRFRGAVGGGLIVGLVEAFSAGYISTAYKDAITFAVLIAVMLLRPNGVFGSASTQRV
ncbi:MAG: branched-chain amino acid ABC transporter permease [Desulfobacterales bacterium]|nr:branched-chain amino acid ABC transporter permease [Desulfobacterales bacterium]